MQIRPHIFRFDIFDLEPQEQLLRRRGHRVRLSGSLTRLLALFVTRSGQLISRNEIADTLWTDSQNIDVTNGINTAVNRLRAVLGDDPVSPRFIETVVGAGYRFVAGVEELEAPLDGSIAEPADDPTGDLLADFTEQPGAEIEPIAEIQAVRRGSRTLTFALFAAGAIVVIGSIGLGITLRFRSQPSPSTTVALFSKPLAPITFNDGDDKVLASAVSPDGTSVAYSDRSGVSIYMLDAHSDRRILSPPAFGVDRIAWDPRHSRLLVSGVENATRQRQAWILSLVGDPPQLLVDDAGGIALSGDTSHIAVTRKGGTEIWIAESSGKNLRRLLSGTPGEIFPFLLWAPAGSRLVFERFSVGRVSRIGSPIAGSGSPAESLEQQDRWSCESIDTLSGRILDVEENIHFDSGYILPDGRLFYPVNESYAELKRAHLMMAKTDPVTGRFLAAPIRAGAFDAGVASSLSASADGSKVAAVLERRTDDVFESPFNPLKGEIGPLNRVTYHSLDNFPHAWTPSGDAILFESRRAGIDSIFKQKLLDSTEDHFSGQMLAHLAGAAAMAEFSPDGKWILFMEFSGRPNHADAIYRVSPSGGGLTQVATSGAIDEFHCSLSGNGICVLRETLNKNQFVFYALDPVTGMGAELARAPWTPNLLGDWSISPDGSIVASADHDPQHPGVRFITVAGPSAGSVRETAVDGFGTLLGATWAADGKTLFVQSRTDTGYQLLLVDLEGHGKLLRESTIPIWAAPSRDGRRLAFPAPTINTNVWVGNASVP